ncbi:MAG: DUF4270 domain-containing protein [Rikenellaceae bacterium]|nr:DUF4270 domain-containing protein [Rikenellaceae bacterium]
MIRYTLKQGCQMKKTKKNTARWGAVVATVGAIFLGGTSCKKIDDTTGTEFIPDHQVVSIAMDSSFQIRTYNVTNDSVMSSNLDGYYYLGTFVDPTCGLTNASYLFQYAPDYTFSKTDSLYGVDPVVDSLFLRLQFDGYVGKGDVAQTFDLYELTEEIYIDSTYYSNFNPAPIVKSTPLATVEYAGDYSTIITTRITDPDFISRLLDTAGYHSPRTFHKRFKGFYLKPRTKDLDAAIVAVNIDYSYLLLHYHNDNPVKKDTTYTYFWFTPNSQTYLNQDIGVMNFDYTNASPDLRLNDKSVSVPTTYIQAYGGITTYLEFSKESVAQIRQKVLDAGFTDIVINKAKFQVNFVDDTPAVMKNTFSRLGMYISYRDPLYYSPIPDYSPSLENQGYVTSYGGYKNQSRYLYEMDITFYAQRLFRQDYDQQGIILGPDLDSTYQLISPMAIHGFGSSAPLRLILTYTMVR